MKLSLFPLVFLFHILFILINAQSESEASGIEGPYFEICVTNDSTPIQFPLTSCTPSIPKSESGHIFRIDTRRNCLNIYSGPGCSGTFIRYQASYMFQGIDNTHAHRWEGDNLVDDEHIQITSIGPCFNKCDPRNWAGMRPEVPVDVILYEDEDYTGSRIVRKTIAGKSCVRVARNDDVYEPLDSMKLSGEFTSTCVELFEDLECQGDSVQLRPGYPYLHDLWYWGFTPHTRANTMKAVSLCGVFCPEEGFTPVQEATLAKITPSTVTTTKVSSSTPFPVFNETFAIQSTPENEESSQLPTFVVILLVCAVLLVIFLTVFGVMFKRRRNLNRGEFNVVYKLQGGNT